jgi:hypothetical protein
MKAKDDNEKLVISVGELKKLVATVATTRSFSLEKHFNSDNIVEIAKSQFPRLEAKVAIQNQQEKTKRLLIIVAAVCLIVGATLVIFAPQSKEKVSYIIAAALAILPLGAIGIQEFRIRALGIKIEGGDNAVQP